MTQAFQKSNVLAATVKPCKHSLQIFPLWDPISKMIVYRPLRRWLRVDGRPAFLSSYFHFHLNLIEGHSCCWSFFSHFLWVQVTMPLSSCKSPVWSSGSILIIWRIKTCQFYDLQCSSCQIYCICKLPVSKQFLTGRLNIHDILGHKLNLSHPLLVFCYTCINLFQNEI